MRIVLQKVSQASVSVDDQSIAEIGTGYLLYVGIMQGDSDQQIQELTSKICSLRLFEGEDGKINDRSILDVHGDILVVSQFTLAGKTKKGNRPDYTAAEGPKRAEELYEQCIDQLRAHGVQRVEHGSFGAHMDVASINDGPVTLILER